MAVQSTKAQEQLKKGETDAISDDPPAPGYITWLHSLAPYRDVNDLHHRIGTRPFDAAGGNHRHRGTDNSVALFENEIITGDLATAGGSRTALKKVISLLVQLGATDQTTN